MGLGAIALGNLLNPGSIYGKSGDEFSGPGNGILGNGHFPAKAKRVIYLFQSGGPSQIELFDYKPELAKLDGKDCPQEFLEGQNFPFLQGIPKMLAGQFPFHLPTRYTASGTV